MKTERTTKVEKKDHCFIRLLIRLMQFINWFDPRRKKTLTKERFLMLFSLMFIFPIFFFLALFSFHYSPNMRATTPLNTSNNIITWFVADRIAYGYSEHSFNNFLYKNGLSFNRIFAKDPKIGDVVIFYNPLDKGKHYIRRCIAKAGETVQMKKGIAYINDIPLKLEFVQELTDKDHKGRPIKVIDYTETLPNGVKYMIRKQYRINESKYQYDDTIKFTVPKGHIFVLGDTRDQSIDSREARTVGFVPLNNLVGKVIWHW